MRSLALFAAVAGLVGLACAPRNPETTHLPPSANEPPPEQAFGPGPRAFSEEKPRIEAIQDVPRIGAINGRIVAVSADKLAVSGRPLAGDRADISMFMGPVTQVTIDGRPARVNQLRPGMEVRTSFTVDRSTVIADHVDARTVAPAASTSPR